MDPRDAPEIDDVELEELGVASKETEGFNAGELESSPPNLRDAIIP